MQLPIRIRLSISYFVIFSVAGVLLCCAAYFLAQRSLYIALDHELDEHVDDVHDFFVAHQLANDFDRARTESAAEFGLKDDGKWLQIADEQGRWIYRARRMLISPHDMPHASTLPLKGSFIEFGVGPKKVRALRRAFTLDGHAFVVETGSTLTKTDQTLENFRNGLLLIVPAVFLMAGFAGHMMSRSALAPVAAIAREAQRIHDGNLENARLPRLKTRDELAHLSQMLNEMLERIESGVRSVRDFTAYASHELRTPVAMIRTEADLALQQQRSGNEYREAIEVIGSEAQRMSALLDSLLFLARADAGAEQVRLEPVDARRLCAQAYEKFRPVFHRSQIGFVSELPAGRVMAMGDAPYLQRLLNIILENAGKYTPAGGRVELRLESSFDSVRFEVSDTGIGIPLMDRAHIFERFRRGANARDAHVNGSGLGLALAAWIAAHHHTRIEIDSNVGAGSTFSWRLPLAPPAGIIAEASLSQSGSLPLAGSR
ncbi:MAG TPA: HAMP domain-containing sensor histidine kinase [Terracidiphilus sp.]|nr:HAMP domain-containing sensor histidine kinase [Terracidiphilus sp.]